LLKYGISRPGRQAFICKNPPRAPVLLTREILHHRSISHGHFGAGSAGGTKAGADSVLELDGPSRRHYPRVSDHFPPRDPSLELTIRWGADMILLGIMLSQVVHWFTFSKGEGWTIKLVVVSRI
jgi:hypothetical protein